MTLPRTPFQSRFGRRLLTLFVGCALVPIIVLAVLSYRHVAGQLRMQSEIRLRQANKALGLAILERLLLLDATLKSIPPAALVQLGAGSGGVRRSATAAAPGAKELQASRMLTAGLDLVAGRRFGALEFVSATGAHVPVFGRLEHGPSIHDHDEDLALGLPVLVAEQADGRAGRVYVMRRVDRSGGVKGTLVGEANPEFLWGTLDQSMPSAGTMISVVDDSGRVLFSSTAGAPVSSDTMAADDEFLQGLTRPAADSLDSATGGVPYVSSSSPLVLDEVFSGTNWQLVLSQSKGEVLGPMAKFTPIFLGVVLASCLMALLLSINQIRRALVPLEELQKGTRRLAQRDFGSRVSVDSRDEFEELGASFNSMALQLDRQFHALATAAEIDRAVLSSTDVKHIVDTLVARVRDVYPCEMMSVTLIATDGTKSLPSMVHDYRDESVRQTRVDLRSGDVQDLLDGPEAFAPPMADRAMPSYLIPLSEQGASTLFVLPLRYQHQLIGIIALGDRGTPLLPEECRVQVRRLADQAAVALTNARMLDQVRTLAFVDSLTGLPNRLSYKERLGQALDDARRQEKLVAAFFIDLDHFSRVNDSLGHEAGDQLLQQVAVRLRSCCRGRDDQVSPAAEMIAPEVARLGGDEFTVIMPGLTDPEDAAKLARRILASLAHPIPVSEQEVVVNASIGIAIYPFDGENLETLLMHADTAMYKAKEQGGSCYQTFSRSMNASALHRLTLEADLRRALAREEFELHYQPIVDAATGAITGAEALVRWRHPDLGLLLPSEFIALAEENGLIIPLGEWVLRTACAQNRRWQEAGLHRVRVLTNLSSRQLERNLPETVSRVLDETSLDARYLGLELTESMLVHHEKESTDTLHALRAMGLHLAVDDFGTGYSSFSYLKHLPLDTLKIDRSFVSEITSHPDDAAITTAITAMGHALGLRVVAEGVETEEQRSLLRKQGCDEMQGYLFSRPVCADDFALLLGQDRPAIPAIKEAARRWKVEKAVG